MSSDLRKEYTRIVWLRYQNANKQRKGLILDEFCATRGITRKSAIRLFSQVPTHFKARPGRKKKYSEHAVYHLRKLWLLMKQMNSKRLKEALPLWLCFYLASAEVKAEYRVGSRYKRTYTTPKTPYQRILECEHVPEAAKDKLTAVFKTLNPFQLRRQMQQKLKEFYKAQNPVTGEQPKQA